VTERRFNHRLALEVNTTASFGHGLSRLASVVFDQRSHGVELFELQDAASQNQIHGGLGGQNPFKRCFKTHRISREDRIDSIINRQGGNIAHRLDHILVSHRAGTVTVKRELFQFAYGWRDDHRREAAPGVDVPLAWMVRPTVPSSSSISAWIPRASSA
jgi:hypothetical protein